VLGNSEHNSSSKPNSRVTLLGLTKTHYSRTALLELFLASRGTDVVKTFDQRLQIGSLGQVRVVVIIAKIRLASGFGVRRLIIRGVIPTVSSGRVVF